MKKTDKNRNKLLVRILVPALIVMAIGVIWVVKNQSTPVAPQASGSPPLTESEEDFMLEASFIDLDRLTGYGLPIIIDFGADACAPCKAMAPVLVAMNEQMRGKAIIKFVDVWKNSDAVGDFPVQVIPTQIFINADGTPYVPSEGMSINFTLYTTRDTREHVYTAHQGGLTEAEMLAILADMGVDG